MTNRSIGPKRSRPRAGGHPVGAAGPVPSNSAAPSIGAARAAAVPSAWVRVTCPECGVVRVRADHVVVRNCIDDQSWSYRARCSSCDITFVGTTPVSLALPAIAAGLAVELWTLPHPSVRRAGEPLQMVDALELHLALLDADWFDELMRVDPLDGR